MAPTCPPPRWSIGQCAAAACLLEVTAAKPGNVHRGADFSDATMLDFALSGLAIAPAMDRASEFGLVGRTVLDAVQATRACVATNTNLGIVLLLAPLAATPRDEELVGGVRRVLARLDAEDARLVYEAIRAAQPGGLGKVDAADVADDAPANLIDAMRLAEDRDLVARQYVNGFHEVLHEAGPWLAEATQNGLALADAIVHVHLRLLAAHGDSLIARKCGREASDRVRTWAARIVRERQPATPAYRREAADFDFWLRADHNRRNPGTTADLVTAALFAGLRDGAIPFPNRFYPKTSEEADA